MDQVLTLPERNLNKFDRAPDFTERRPDNDNLNNSVWVSGVAQVLSHPIVHANVSKVFLLMLLSTKSIL